MVPCFLGSHVSDKEACSRNTSNLYAYLSTCYRAFGGTYLFSSRLTFQGAPCSWIQPWVGFQQRECDWNWYTSFSVITHKNLLSLWWLVLTQHSLELLGREFQWELSRSSWLVDMFVRDCLSYMSWSEKICSLWAVPFPGVRSWPYKCRDEAEHKWAFMQLLFVCSWLWIVMWLGSSSSPCDFSAVMGCDRIVSWVNSLSCSCQGILSHKQN